MIQRHTVQSFFIIILSCFLGFSMQAQEAAFAQYYSAPTLLNPAMVGVFDGQFRLNTNFRQQWGNTFAANPIRTTQAAFEYRKRVMKSDYFGFGINALNDETGYEARIKTVRGNLGVSFQKQLNDARYSGVTQFLSGGLQVGLGQHFLNFGDVWFERQFDSIALAVNSSLPSGEITPQSQMYVDYNAGLLFYTVWDNNRSFYVGGSLHHMTQPNISFIGDTKERLRRRITFHGGGEVPFNENVSLMPTGMITIQGPSMWANAGANIRYSDRNWSEAAIRVGAAIRMANKYISEVNAEGKSVQIGTGVLTDALTFTGILELNRLLIGASYDLHMSTIKTPTYSRGAWELSLIYTASEKRKARTDCPKF